MCDVSQACHCDKVDHVEFQAYHDDKVDHIVF